MATVISVETVIPSVSIATVWKCWTTPADIMQWNAAHESWHCPAATNDLRAGGAFSFTMAARDGSASFDFGGTYDRVEENKEIAYTIGDGRHVTVTFSAEDDGVKVVEQFEAEKTHSHEQQQGGWQSILNNFKRHVESSSV